MFYITPYVVFYKQNYSIFDICNHTKTRYDMMLYIDTSELNLLFHYDNIIEKAPVLSCYRVNQGVIEVAWRTVDYNNSYALNVIRSEMMMRGQRC